MGRAGLPLGLVGCVLRHVRVSLALGPSFIKGE